MHKVKEGLPGLLLAKLNRREESAEHPVEKLTFVSDQPDEQQLGIHGRHATTRVSLAAVPYVWRSKIMGGQQHPCACVEEAALHRACTTTTYAEYLG